MPYETNKLGPSFAVEIVGCDLSSGLSEAKLGEIRDLWLEHKVVAFRDQDLGDDDLIGFAKRFGPPHVHVRAQFRDLDRPEIMLVSNIKEDGRDLGALGDGEIVWHTDQAYSREPALGTMLYAVEIPADGGNTWFCDMAMAYERMPADLRRRIEGLRVEFDMGATKRTQRLGLPAEQRAQMPPVAHPVVRTHPLIGRKALYLSPNHSTGIEGMAADEGLALIEELTEWATRPEFTYEHMWRVGDVVMWDNTSTMHRREAFPATQSRLLKRTGFLLPPELAVPF